MNFSNLLPFEKYTLTTDLSVEEVLTRLAGSMIPESEYSWSFFSNRYTKPYRGTINRLSFRMIRNISYRNSFLPVIKGKVTRTSGHTEVAIRMLPAGFVLFFMAIWLGLTGFVCLIILVSAITHWEQVLQNGFSPPSLIPFGMFAFGSGLLYFAFKAESKVSKRFLADLLKAKE